MSVSQRNDISFGQDRQQNRSRWTLDVQSVNTETVTEFAFTVHKDASMGTYCSDANTKKQGHHRLTRVPEKLSCRAKITVIEASKQPARAFAEILYAFPSAS